MNCTIQDIFELRKAGKFEEAFTNCLPMYREHHGHYTTLCMFWTSIDMIRVYEERGDRYKAENLLKGCYRLYSYLQDKEGEAAKALFEVSRLVLGSL